MNALADIFCAVEALGEFPSQLQGLLVKLIPKPASSDTRPIGLFKGLVRVWGRARKKQISGWMDNEAAHGDTNNMLAGRHTLDAVWRAQMRAFLGHARGLHSVEIMWDMLKFYEHMEHPILFHQAASQGFPLSLLRVSFAMYRWDRTILVDFDVAAHPIKP